jgi:hypothetical protein
MKHHLLHCACNKVTTGDHGRSAKYIRYLEKEIDGGRCLMRISGDS